MRAWLNTHRQLTAPPREWHFFDEELDIERSWPRYVFSPGFRLPVGPEGVHDLDIHTFEKTPGYFDRDNRGRPVPELVRRMLPSVRLVVMLRDPIDRAYSAFQMGRRPLGVRAPRAQMRRTRFGELIERHSVLGSDPQSTNSRIFAIGQYALHLERWLDRFPRAHFYFVFHERFIEQPRTEAARVAAFLGLDPDGFGPPPHGSTRVRLATADGRPTYRANYAALADDDRRRLAEFYAPWNLRLRGLLPELDFPW